MRFDPPTHTHTHSVWIVSDQSSDSYSSVWNYIHYTYHFMCACVCAAFRRAIRNHCMSAILIIDHWRCCYMMYHLFIYSYFSPFFFFHFTISFLICSSFPLMNKIASFRRPAKGDYHALVKTTSLGSRECQLVTSVPGVMNPIVI